MSGHQPPAAPAAASDSDSDEGITAADGETENAGMSDFDLMRMRKKNENSRRRKRKNIDIINDNDDLIMQLIRQMREAAEVSGHAEGAPGWVLNERQGGVAERRLHASERMI